LRLYGFARKGGKVQSQQGLINEIKELLSQIKQEDIYRSVYDTKGNILAKGLLPTDQQLTNDFEKVNFRNKTVIDLGCNLGFFTFIAAKLCASNVIGIDQSPDVIAGSKLLADLYDLTNVNFKCFDMEKQKNNLGKFDIVVLVDFFGRANVRKKKVRHFLRLSEDLSKKYILTSFRPINRLEQDLKMTRNEFDKLYSSTYIKDNKFYLIDYINDIMDDRWSVTPVSNYSGEFSKSKLLFLYERKLSNRSPG
jgi:SAM-dependent methyltransferase